MLKTQWVRWEAQHHRRILKDIHFRGSPVASEPKGSVVRDTDFNLVNDAIKIQVCRQYAPLSLLTAPAFHFKHDILCSCLRAAEGLYPLLRSLRSVSGHRQALQRQSCTTHTATDNTEDPEASGFHMHEQCK
jgi:hypothetical protein